MVHTCIRKHEGLGRTEDFTRNHQSGQTWNGHFLGLAQKVSVPDSPWVCGKGENRGSSPKFAHGSTWKDTGSDLFRPE